MDAAFWRGKTVLVTGHTGFKGSWLSLWLASIGARVVGYSVDVPTTPSLYEDAAVGDDIDSVFGDVRDRDALRSCFARAKPDIVIHLAAQSLVRQSYAAPVDTYSTNVMGTVNLLEAVRESPSVRVVLVVTSDKCYENREWLWGYRETEPMGGRDPYSSSKGCAELVTAAYRASYFDQDRSVFVASARAGNVIGGGDWAADRLVPDLVRAFQHEQDPEIRNPGAVRPWQFVLDALHGYAMLVERMWAQGHEFAEPWNFGPDNDCTATVARLVDQIAGRWGTTAASLPPTTTAPHEARFLKLDSSKAESRLGWKPLLSLDDALDWLVEWYRGYCDGDAARELTIRQLTRYEQAAEA